MENSDFEGQIFYLKTKADYYRYACEYAQGEIQSKVSDSALEAYSQALQLAETNLSVTDPIRLKLVNNFSMFHYEMLSNQQKGFSMAKQAFDDVINDLETLDDANYKDVAGILQTIRENITLWSAEMEDGGEGESG